MFNNLKVLIIEGKNYLRNNKKRGGAYSTEAAGIILVVLLICAAIAADTGAGGGIQTIWTDMKTGVESAITKAVAHFQ